MFNRSLISKQKIIIFDGIPGGGKSLLRSLLSGIPKIDQYVLNVNIDQTAALYNLKKIDLATAVYLLRTNHNIFFYDNVLFRTTNFRKINLNLDEKKMINFLRNKIRKKYLSKILKLNILYNKEIIKKF